MLPAEAAQCLKRGGALDPIGVTGVLKVAEVHSASGCVTIQADEGTARVWLRRGKIIHVKTAVSEAMLAFILVNNKFMTPSIVRRCLRRFRTECRKQKLPLKKDLPAFGDYLVRQNILSRQHREEVQRLFCEWQVLALFGWRDGVWEFAEGETPKHYEELPGLFPSRLLWRLEQLLNTGTDVSENYPWQYGIDLRRGELAMTPLPVLLQAVHLAKLSGELTLKFGWRKLRMRFDEGAIASGNTLWLERLGALQGSFRFRKIVKARLKRPLTADSSEINTDFFSEFYSEKRLLEMIAQQRRQTSIAVERPKIRETTNMRAWVEVKFEEAADGILPILRWFVPLVLPLVLMLLYVEYKNGAIQDGIGVDAYWRPSLYETASGVMRGLRDRELLPLEKMHHTYKTENGCTVSIDAQSGKYLVHITRPPSAFARSAKLDLEIVDLNPKANKGRLLVRRLSAS